MRKNWTELNPELLYLISKKLENFSNIIRFRSVCKQWRLVVGPTDYSPRLPWIFYRVHPSSNETQTNTVDFIVYSVPSNSTSRITLPIANQEFMSLESTFGYLLLCQNSFESPRLFNPVTKKTFHLPFSNFPHFTIYMGPDPDNNSSTVKDGVHMVICQILKDGAEIGFWKSQNNEFTSFRIPIASYVMGYYQGKLFIYSDKIKNVRVFEMTTRTELNIVISNTVEDRDGAVLVNVMANLLWVSLSRKIVGRCYIVQFSVYRLEHTDDFGQCRWIKLKDIGDRMLFLNFYRVSAFCLSSSDFNRLRGNCIYYLHQNRALRYNLEDGTTDKLFKCPSNFMFNWFMPCLS